MAPNLLPPPKNLPHSKKMPQISRFKCPKICPKFEKWGKSEENGASFQDFTRDSRCGKSPQSPQSPPNGANLRGGESLQMGKRKWGKLGKNGASWGDFQKPEMPQTAKKSYPNGAQNVTDSGGCPILRKMGQPLRKCPKLGRFRTRIPASKGIPC